MPRKKMYDAEYATDRKAENKKYAWTDRRYAYGYALEKVRMLGCTMISSDEFDRFGSQYDEISADSNMYLVDNNGRDPEVYYDNDLHVYMGNDMLIADYMVLEEDFDLTKELIGSVKENLGKKINELRKEKIDEKVIRYWEDAKLLCDVEEVNLLQGASDKCYLLQAIDLYGMGPSFGNGKKEQIEKVVAGLKGIDGNEDIYDTYMDFFHYSMQEIRIEKMRQELDRSGERDPELERRYMAELKANHEKVTEAFDKLNQIENKDAYLPYMQNGLRHLTEIDPRMAREFNSSAGAMKGECQAIEMGWDYDELGVLGLMGMYEARVEAMKKSGVGLETEEKRAELAKAEEGYKALKESCWNKKVESKEDKLEVIGKIRDFYQTYCNKNVEKAFTRMKDMLPVMDRIENKIKNPKPMAKSREEGIKEFSVIAENLEAMKKAYMGHKNSVEYNNMITALQKVTEADSDAAYCDAKKELGDAAAKYLKHTKLGKADHENSEVRRKCAFLLMALTDHEDYADFEKRANAIKNRKDEAHRIDVEKLKKMPGIGAENPKKRISLDKLMEKEGKVSKHHLKASPDITGPKLNREELQINPRGKRR
ncbi:MAG: hypothetical protein K6B69_15790 [Lachnospiraceae bacterium]|nr:hypothetical protein [Lachnospiraceae bacterium]